MKKNNIVKVAGCFVPKFWKRTGSIGDHKPP